MHNHLPTRRSELVPLLTPTYSERPPCVFSMCRTFYKTHKAIGAPTWDCAIAQALTTPLRQAIPPNAYLKRGCSTACVLLLPTRRRHCALDYLENRTRRMAHRHKTAHSLRRWQARSTATSHLCAGQCNWETTALLRQWSTADLIRR